MTVRFERCRRDHRRERVVLRQGEADHSGAQRLHPGDDAVHDAVDLAMSLRLAEQVRHHANSRALQSGLVQEVRVTLRMRPMPNAVMGSAAS